MSVSVSVGWRMSHHAAVWCPLVFTLHLSNVTLQHFMWPSNLENTTVLLYCTVLTDNNYNHCNGWLVAGDSGVGKSSLLVRFADNHFSGNYITTIGKYFCQWQWVTFRHLGLILEIYIFSLNVFYLLSISAQCRARVFC